MASRKWAIEIEDTGVVITVSITNVETGISEQLTPVSYPSPNDSPYLDFETRDAAIGELFSGPLPNIRDSFDKVGY